MVSARGGVAISILFLTVLLTGPAHGRLLFYDPCESNDHVPLENGGFSDWYKNSHGNVLDNTLGFSTEQARAGNGSYRFYLQPYEDAEDWVSDCELSFRGLTEQEMPANFTPGTEYWMGFSVFVPESQRWPENDVHPEGGGHEWALLWQFHGSGNDCDISGINPVQSANLTGNDTGYIEGVSGYRHRISGDTRRCLTDRDYEETTVDMIPFSRGQWHDYVINFKFTADPEGGGFYRVWQDDNPTPVVDQRGINMYNLPSGRGPYFVFGAYAHMTTSVTVFFDEIRVGDESSSYDEVAPRGEVPSCAEAGGTCCAENEACAGERLFSVSSCADACCSGTCEPATCTDLSYSCCSECGAGAHPELDATCDAGTVCCQACAQQSTYEALYTAEEPQIDGHIEEHACVPTIELVAAETGATGVYSLLWDERALYVAAQVRDQDLEAFHEDRDGNLYQDDSLELMVDTLGDLGPRLLEDDFKLITNILTTQYDAQSNDAEWNGAWDAAVVLSGTVGSADEDDGYTVEMRIPWSELGLAAPSEGARLGMEIKLNDRHTAGQSSEIAWDAWANNNGGTVNDPNGWGELRLSAQVPEQCQTTADGDGDADADVDADTDVDADAADSDASPDDGAVETDGDQRDADTDGEAPQAGCQCSATSSGEPTKTFLVALLFLGVFAVGRRSAGGP